MTKAEIRLKARRRCNETTDRLVENDELDSEIDDACTDMAVKLKLIELKDVSMTTDGNETLDLPDEFIAQYPVKVALDGNRITRVTMDELDYLRDNPDGLTHYYIFGRTIGIYPVPASGLALTLYWIQRPAEVVENVLATGLADSGTTTTLVHDAFTQVNDSWNGQLLTIVGGTNEGESRIIEDYDLATTTITVALAFSSAIDATSQYKITEVPRIEDIAPGIMREHQIYVVAYVCAYIRDKDSDPQQAEMFLNRYNNFLEEKKKEPQARDSAPAWKTPGDIAEWQEDRRQGNLP